MTNAELADHLLAYAALLELRGSSRFSSRAYRRAADLVRATPVSVAELVRQGRVRELRGIGSSIGAMLEELVRTGRFEALEVLENDGALPLVAHGRRHGISATRMLSIVRALGVRHVGELDEAVASGRLLEVPGIGPAREAEIRAALRSPPTRPGLRLNESLALAGSVAEAVDGVVAGDPRRFCELSFDLAVVCAADDPQERIARFTRHPQIVTLTAREDRRVEGLTVTGTGIRLVVADRRTFGTELVRATGSAEYVAALEPLPVAPDERSVYHELGLLWRPPERREAWADDVEALLEPAAIRGDLHCHTDWSDGRATVEEMADEARRRGYDYLAICDHTPNVRVVAGLDADALRRQGELIAALDERLRPFRVLRGVECDIRADGTLDVPDDVLAELDWVQISLHAGQRRPRGELTRIVCEAMRHPAACALSHPTGRLLGHRPENALDLDAVFAVAVETGVALEINGLPDRLDLSARHAADALAAGARLVVASDAHSTRGLAAIEYAVGVARRAGAAPADVLNTLPLDELLAWRDRRGAGPV